MDQIDLSEFEQNLLYKFNNINILEEALCHSSFANEQLDTDMKDNERLEFLGDAVLDLVIGHILMQQYPDMNEGDLSRMRSILVNESQLATIAHKIELGRYIKLGKGEIQTNGKEKKSILADTFEAIIAAVYLDGGFDAAFKIISAHFSSLFHLVSAPAADRDYKSRIQELVQETHNAAPVYRVISASGPDHDKTFRVQLKVYEFVVEGIGKSKKVAEQDAARRALELLTKGSTILAGPYHPAFGGLVYSEIFLDKAVSILESKKDLHDMISIRVNPKNISKMRGLKNRNIEILKTKFHIKLIEIIPDITLAEDMMEIE